MKFPLAVPLLASLALAGSPEGLDYRSPEGLDYGAVVAQPFRAAAHEQASKAADCADWQACRALALEAAGRQEYETFHDLAWRAVQLGPRNDAALLFLLARAQSLSGRPHDALVMLRRIAASGTGRDAVTSADFERARALREWPEVEALLTGAPPPAAGTAPGSKPPLPAKSTRGLAASKSFAFDAASYRPSALAYDAVSKRFLIADTDVSRLAVIDEFSRNLATLASGRGNGFGTVSAIAIDPRAGDLWVASADGSSGSQVPALHRLQLISGRILRSVPVAASAGRLVDLDVSRDGTVTAVQADGHVLRLRAGAASLEVVAAIDTPLASVAVSPQNVVYLSGTNGLLRLDQGRALAVKAPAGVDLSAAARIRFSRGSLVAVQRAGEAHRVVRLRLSRDGRAVTGVEVLDAALTTPNPAAATIVGDVFYYVASTEGDGLEIRRLAIK